MSGIGIEIPEKGEHVIRLVGIRHVFDQHFHHGSPVGGPSRLILLYSHGRIDEIRIMKMMVVDIRIRRISGGITDQRFPIVVIVEYERIFSLCCFEPVLQPFPDGIDELVAGCDVSHLIGNLGHLYQLVHGQSFIVRIGP